MVTLETSLGLREEELGRVTASKEKLVSMVKSPQVRDVCVCVALLLCGCVCFVCFCVCSMRIYGQVTAGTSS